MSNSIDASRTGLEIAVIGMAGKFPGAKNIKEYWDNINLGLESISFFTDDELEEYLIEKDIIKNKNYIKAKGVLQDCEYFDSEFFGYSPGEAEIMDPQLRLLHECTWEALEHAGCNPEKYKGLIGVYYGALSNYNWVFRLLNQTKTPSEQFEIASINDRDFFSTLISYKLNLRGPSVNIQTACSTSLVAIHLACQGLLNGESDISLAGGVSIQVPKKSGYIYQEGMVFSQDGHCRAFDEEANGTVGGDGVSVVVLKRLEDAIKDGDYIHAIIRGSAINNDGARKNGFTAPSVKGQSEVIKAAQCIAEVEPEDITYIETHGTGTKLGDPIEIEGLKLAFDTTTKQAFCSLGSVKSNIGHLDVAAGGAGLIKTVLALENKQLPPSINFKIPNSVINLVESPFYINTESKAWDNNGRPLIAGVSSFGLGGTNAHIILEGWENSESIDKGREYKAVIISAKNEEELESLVQNISSFLKENKEANLADIAYTLQVGRKDFNYRKAYICSTIENAIMELEKVDSHNVLTNIVEGKASKNTFIFAGYDFKYRDKFLQLYKNEKSFRKEVDYCFEILKDSVWNITEDAFNYFNNKLWIDNNGELLSLFIFQYSLSKMIIEWGFEPSLIIGKDIGVCVGACLAETISVKDALKIVWIKSKLRNMKEDTWEKSRYINEIKDIKLNSPKVKYSQVEIGEDTSNNGIQDIEYWIDYLNNKYEGHVSELIKIIDKKDSLILNFSIDEEIRNTLIESVNDKKLINIMIKNEDKTFLSRSLIEVVTKGWINGVNIEWNKFYEQEKRYKVPLPTYPFKRTLYSKYTRGLNKIYIDKFEPEDKRSEVSYDIENVEELFNVMNDIEGNNAIIEDGNNLIKNKLIRIWQEVFGIKNISEDDNFIELGGNSLKAITVVSKIHKELNIKISFKEFFECGNIKNITKVLEKAKKEEYYLISKIEEMEYYPTSSAQKRLYIMQQMNLKSTAYNVPVALYLQGYIDINKIEKTFLKMIERHEILRTTFEVKNGEIMQKIHKNIKFSLEDFETIYSIEECLETFVKYYDLAKAPLIRAGIIKSEHKYILIVDIHHIITDDISLHIFAREFEALYNDEVLPELKIQYKDFAVWQNKIIESEYMRKQERYWVEKFEGNIPVLNLPLDILRPKDRTFKGDTIYFELRDEIRNDIYSYIKLNNSTLFMFFFSIYNILLSEYCQQNDVVIGTTIAGRQMDELSNVMGFFANTIVMRNQINSDKPFLSILNDIKQNSLEAYENQDYQFDKLIKKLGLQGETNRNPLFDVGFDLLSSKNSNIGQKTEDTPKTLKVSQYDFENKVSVFDLGLEILEFNEKIVIKFKYSIELFYKSTIEKMGKNYLKVIEQVLKNKKIEVFTELIEPISMSEDIFSEDFIF